MWNLIKPQPKTLRVWQLGLLVALIGFWYAMTTPGLVPNFMFENDRQAAFFFGETKNVAQRIRRPTRAAISSTPASGVLVRAKMALVVVRMMSDT